MYLFGSIVLGPKGVRCCMDLGEKVENCLVGIIMHFPFSYTLLFLSQFRQSLSKSLSHKQSQQRSFSKNFTSGTSYQKYYEQSPSKLTQLIIINNHVNNL